MTARPSASVLCALLASCLAVALAAPPAYADFWGGDIPVLTGIFTQASEAVRQGTQALSVLRSTYDNTKRLAGYADDAYQSYQHFAHYNARLFNQDVTQTVEATFPDVAYFHREVTYGGAWAQGYGELTRLGRLCLTGNDYGCREVAAVMTYRQTRELLSRTFGEAPKGAAHLEAVDHEAAQGLRIGQAQAGRSARTRGVSDSLIRQCATADASDADSLASCQAAGSSAQVEALKVQADIADQVAEQNRLTAIRLEQANATHKAELTEAGERRELLLQALETGAPAPSLVHSEGVDFLRGP